MFRNIQDRFSRRLEAIKNKTKTQTELEKTTRSFLIGEFGPVGESLSFEASQENNKIHIRLKSKTAANELVLRSGKLRKALKVFDSKIETINID